MVDHRSHGLLPGRSPELAQLAGMLRDARGAGGGRGRLVLITGEAGVGKTALAGEFLRRVAAAEPRAVTLSAVCVEDLSRFRPYGPFRDLLAQLSGLQDDPLVAAVLRKEVPGWLPGAVPASGRHALFDQFVALCRAIGRQRALVLLIDDLHEADLSSLDLLARLAGALGSISALVLATADLTDPESARSMKAMQHKLGSHMVELTLRNLDESAVLELAESVLRGSFGAELTEWLPGAARGNALRAEQLVRWLVERGALRKRLLRYALRPEGLPEQDLSLEQIITERIDALEPNLRWHLEAASLAGSVIDSSVVARQLGMAEGDVLARLRSAEEDYHLIQGVGERHWASGSRSVRFRFRHPLIRGVIRARISEKRRDHLLTRAAETLEQLAGEGAAEIADEIAGLYGAGNGPRIHEWCLKAADLAERLYALYEVEELLKAAAQTCSAEPEQLRIKYRLARLYSATEREPEAEALLVSVFERATQLEDDVIRVRAGVLYSWLQLDRDVPLARISALAGELVDVGRSVNRPEELVTALDLSCTVAERLGRAEEALLMAEEALHVAEESGEAEILAQAAYRLARVHVSWGSPEEGRALAQRALDIFTQVDERAGVAVCHDLLGLANFRAGDWDGALHHWHAALENLEVAGVAEDKIALQLNIAELLTLRGDFERARELFQRGLDRAEEIEDRGLDLRCRTGLARLQFERGEYASVLEETDEVRKRLPESGAWKADFQTTAIRALAYLELGDEVQAWQEAARLEQLYQGKEGWFERRAEGDAVRIRVIDLDADSWLAGMVAQQGIGETAETDLYGEGFLQYHQAHVFARNRLAEARKAAARAVELFERLGAEPMRVRARRFLDELAAREDLSESTDTDASDGEGIDSDQIDKWFEGLEG